MVDNRKEVNLSPVPLYIVVSVPPYHYILWYAVQNVTLFGSIPLYIVVQGLNSSPFDYRPQYIVAGNVDKTFLDYIIITSAKGCGRRFAAFHHTQRKISFFIQSHFLLNQEESYYEESH